MMLLTPRGRVLVNPAHIIRAHVARNRAPEPTAPWQVNLKMPDGWMLWDTYQSEQAAIEGLIRLKADLSPTR